MISTTFRVNDSIDVTVSSTGQEAVAEVKKKVQARGNSHKIVLKYFTNELTGKVMYPFTEVTVFGKTIQKWY